MNNSWDNYDPAPIEYLHGRLMDLFHEWRVTRTESTVVPMDGCDLSKLIAKAKMETYEKYPGEGKPRLKQYGTKPQ